MHERSLARYCTHGLCFVLLKMRILRPVWVQFHCTHTRNVQYMTSPSNHLGRFTQLSPGAAFWRWSRASLVCNFPRVSQSCVRQEVQQHSDYWSAGLRTVGSEGFRRGQQCTEILSRLLYEELLIPALHHSLWFGFSIIDTSVIRGRLTSARINCSYQLGTDFAAKKKHEQRSQERCFNVLSKRVGFKVFLLWHFIV